MHDDGRFLASSPNPFVDANIPNIAKVVAHQSKKQAKQKDGQAAQGEQYEFPNVYLSPVLLLGLQQELHRRPRSRSEFL